MAKNASLVFSAILLVGLVSLPIESQLKQSLMDWEKHGLIESAGLSEITPPRPWHSSIGSPFPRS